LGAVPDLMEQADALDAAIDMALRWLAQYGQEGEPPVEELIKQFPDLAPAIREAAALNNVLWSTDSLRRHVAASRRPRLPCDFGPTLEGGGRRYQLLELLGEGSSGAVYLAVDRPLSEPGHEARVAIKVLTDERRSARRRQQLRDEATKARRIEHPNVARVLDRGVSDGGEDYIVYEHVDGGDLVQRVRQQRAGLPPDEAVRLMVKIARGVHAAHMAGLVHNDLGPRNIILTRQGEPKVSDFGIAVRTEEPPAHDDTGYGYPVGNLAFMSPEQFRGAPGALTIPSDIYALGGILYWLLTGRLPNGADAEAIRRTHDSAREGREATPLHPYCPGADRDLEAICRRAMAVRPADRFGSAAEVADNLEAWLGHRPVAWTNPSTTRRLALAAKRQPALAAALALLALLTAGAAWGLGYLASVNARQQTETTELSSQLDVEQGRRTSFYWDIEKMQEKIQQLAADRIEDELLPMLWTTEWLFGPTVLGDTPERAELWHLRVDTVRDLVAEARDRGEDGDLETLWWETALGFWLVKAGAYEEAETLMTLNEARWADLLDVGDPWLGAVEAIQVCATAGRMLSRFEAGEIEGDVTALASDLERLEDELNARKPGSPLHTMVRATMLRVDRSGVLKSRVQTSAN
jgi:serine/threonine protein kinase